MNYKAAKNYIINQLKDELNSQLVYHNLHHTLDVLNSVKLLSHQESLSTDQLIILKTAALYHDSGMIETYTDHESASMKFAMDALPDFEYTELQIQQVCELIWATRMPQTATTISEKILCDADLDYLGRDDYFLISHSLRLEWKYYNNDIPLKDWYKMQIRFLKDHSYFTLAAKQLRQPGKEYNCGLIEELLKK
ncbi:MAG: HD domain-containing protein [Bacteroidales bacterium]|nr:HD domain-containing protein [Bacteroidales bacterium]